MTAETFYQAIRSIHRYEGSCQLKTWLFQIAKNLWLKQCSKTKQESNLFHPNAPCECTSDPMDEIVDASEEKITFYEEEMLPDAPDTVEQYAASTLSPFSIRNGS